MKATGTRRFATETKGHREIDGARICVYVRAELAASEERMVRALGVEKDFEVIVGQEAPEEQSDKLRERKVLVLVSQENPQEDLL